RRRPWTAWSADCAVAIVVSGALSFFETRNATSPSTALITTKTPATIRNAAQYGSPSASSPVAAANSSITHAESRRNSSTAAQAAMMPGLTARAVISCFARSISWWTPPRSSSRVDWAGAPMARWVGGVPGSVVVLIMVGAYGRGLSGRRSEVAVLAGQSPEIRLRVGVAGRGPAEVVRGGTGDGATAT